MADIRKKVQKMIAEAFDYNKKALDAPDLVFSIEEFYKNLVKEIQIPDKLYRYRKNVSENEKYAESEIVNREIFLSPTRDFNDIFDSKPVFIKNQAINPKAGMTEYLYSLAQQGKDMGYWDESKQLKSELSDTYREMLKVACFSENNKNIPMWYFYANKYKGICIEYDIKDYKEKVLVEKDLQILPAIYTNDVGKYMANRHDGKKESVYINSMLKSKDWEFEKEWRLVSCQDKNSKEGGIIVPSPEITVIYYIKGKVDEIFLERLKNTNQADKLRGFSISDIGGLV